MSVRMTLQETAGIGAWWTRLIVMRMIQKSAPKDKNKPKLAVADQTGAAPARAPVPNRENGGRGALAPDLKSIFKLIVVTCTNA